MEYQVLYRNQDDEHVTNMQIYGLKSTVSSEKA